MRTLQKTDRHGRIKIVRVSQQGTQRPVRIAGSKYGNDKPGDALAEVLGKWIDKLPGMKLGCQRCKDLQQQMNKQGTAWCRANKNTLVAQLINNGAKNNSLLSERVMQFLIDSPKLQKAPSHKIRICHDCVATNVTPVRRDIPL